ncbi:MAG: DNA polymerase III subunit delta' [Polyangiaceae bacterium]|nr:DNA polymerase III subunit delta' [Polyangiaceae bacterium]
MSFAGIVGQEVAVTTLRRALSAGRVHHAYRFEGPRGVGKHLAALSLAQALLCPSGGEGCGACDACKRVVTVASSEPHVPQHPDVLMVELGLYDAETLGRKSDETRDISVAQIRKVVLARMPFQPHEGRARVVIVRDAHLLNVQAANALLKTLEEPPARTHFVLTTPRPDDLLDTIRSRTLRVRFGPLGDGALTELLLRRGITGDQAARAVALAGGSAEAALAAVDQDEASDEAAFVEAAEAAVVAPDSTAVMKLADVKVARDVFRARLLALAREQARRCRAAADARAAEALAARYSIVVDALDVLDRNPAQPLLLESVLLRMRAV